ncbi:glycosyltransferase family 8 protein, partial [Candidatus Neomarinimicrobiota bacterium]
MEKYSVVFITDQNYIQHLGVAIYSLLNNNKELVFDIYIINNGIDKEEYNKLELIASKYHCRITNILANDDIFSNVKIDKHFTKTTYYRLLIPTFIKVDKVLFLDSDIVVNNSIEELYSTNIDDYMVAAVESPGFDRHRELKMDANAKYFNSGVLLINVKRWIQENVLEKVINFVESNPSDVKYLDQCGLNAIINGNWKELPLKFNQMTRLFNKYYNIQYECFPNYELKEAKENPVIIHYSGLLKPWHFRCNHPYKRLYWKYLKLTPFKKYIPEDLTILNVI